MNDIPPIIPSPSGPKSSPVFALSLGFLPSVMLLLLFAIDPRGKSPPALLLLLCLASVIFCFVSSRLLFKRKTSLAVTGGVLLLLLNGFISFALGCGAVFSSVH